MSKDIFDGRLVGQGENPRGATFVTPNGVAHERGDGRNHQFQWGESINGPRWEMPPEGVDILGGAIPSGALSPDKPKRSRNANRTGE